MNHQTEIRTSCICWVEDVLQFGVKLQKSSSFNVHHRTILKEDIWVLDGSASIVCGQTEAAAQLSSCSRYSWTNLFMGAGGEESTGAEVHFLFCHSEREVAARVGYCSSERTNTCRFFLFISSRNLKKCEEGIARVQGELEEGEKLLVELNEQLKTLEEEAGEIIKACHEAEVSAPH